MTEPRFVQKKRAELKAAYLAGTESACPFCGYWDIVGGEITVDGANVFQRVRCQSDFCGKRWLDIYHRHDFVELDEYGYFKEEEGSSNETQDIRTKSD